MNLFLFLDLRLSHSKKNVHNQKKIGPDPIIDNRDPDPIEYYTSTDRALTPRVPDSQHDAYKITKD